MLPRYLGLIERHTQQAQQAPSAVHVAPLQMRSGSVLMAEISSQYDMQKQPPVQEPGGGLAIAFGATITMRLDSALLPAPLAAGEHTLILSVTDLAGGTGFSQPLSFTMD